MADETQGAPQPPPQGPQVQPVLAPQYYATGVQILQQSNDFAVIFMRSHPSVAPLKSGETVAFLQVTALIQMSPQTAKDLHIALGSQICAYEKEWGPIETEYTRRLAGK